MADLIPRQANCLPSCQHFLAKSSLRDWHIRIPLSKQPAVVANTPQTAPDLATGDSC